MTSLEDLNVSETEINDEGLRAISTALTRLIKLNLTDCGLIPADGFECLSLMTLLEDLMVGGTMINDEGLRAIATSLTRLTKLDLGSCESITGAVFTCLSSMASLKDLNVRETNINDDGIRAVDSLPLLKTLDLDSCRGISRVQNPPFSNAVVIASALKCFEGLAAEDEEDEY